MSIGAGSSELEVSVVSVLTEFFADGCRNGPVRFINKSAAQNNRMISLKRLLRCLNFKIVSIFEDWKHIKIKPE